MPNGNGHANTAEIKAKIKKLEEEVADLQPNGSCHDVRKHVDRLLVKIQLLKEQQLEQKEI